MSKTQAPNSTTDLRSLIAACKCGVHITVNEHRDYYKTAIQQLQELEWAMNDLEIEPDVRKIMEETNTIVCVQAYPDTPVGFFIVYHYDIDEAIATVLKAVT